MTHGLSLAPGRANVTLRGPIERYGALLIPPDARRRRFAPAVGQLEANEIEHRDINGRQPFTPSSAIPGCIFAVHELPPRCLETWDDGLEYAAWHAPGFGL